MKDRPPQSQMHPDSILIVRLSAMGDIVMATPLASALKRTYPMAKICWLVQPEWRDLLAGHPAVDEVLVWPRNEWTALWREKKLWSLLRAIRSFGSYLKGFAFDLGIDAQGLLKSALLLRLSGARHRIGLKSKERSHWLLDQTVAANPDNSRISSEYLSLANALGLVTASFEPTLELDGEQRAASKRLLDSLGVSRPYITFCPFTTRPQKHWPETYWAELGSALCRQSVGPVLLLGGKADNAAARRIVKLAGANRNGRLLNLAGRTTIAEAAGLVAGSELVVAVDTGLGHMGIAFDRPTVMLFGSTRPYTVTTQDNVAVLYHDMHCAPCRRHPTCNGAYTCMKNLVVGDVLRQCRELAPDLAGSRP